MGRTSTALTKFIKGLPDSKLSGYTGREYTLHKDTDFRLDIQGLTRGDPHYYNLRVLVSNESNKNENGKTVASAIVPMDGSWTPAMIRDKLLSAMKI